MNHLPNISSADKLVEMSTRKQQGLAPAPNALYGEGARALRQYLVNEAPWGYACPLCFRLFSGDGGHRHNVRIRRPSGGRLEALGTWPLWYFRSPAFADRYKATKPFRVLTVTTSAERLANMKKATEEAGGQTWFWFSTYAALADPADMLHRPSWFMAGQEAAVAFPYPRLEHPFGER